MTSSEFQTTTNDPFAYLESQPFVVLTTYRKDGTAVPTTIWFAYDQGQLYFTTQKQAGKVKRIRNNGHVEITPSDRIGNLLGLPQVAGQARELSIDEQVHAHAVLRAKYGEQFDQIVSQSNSEQRTYVVISPLQPA